MQCTTIEGHGDTTTPNNTPVNLVLFELTEHASTIGRLLILARRPATGASKAWDISCLMKRDNSVVTNLANVGGSAPYGAAADLTALLTCAIAFFTDGVNIGVTVTGLAAEDIHWCIKFD